MRRRLVKPYTCPVAVKKVGESEIRLSESRVTSGEAMMVPITNYPMPINPKYSKAGIVNKSARSTLTHHLI